MSGKVDWNGLIKKAGCALNQYKYVFLVVLVGIILLLLPSGKKTAGMAQTPVGAGTVEFSVEAMERKLEEALSQVEGAGKVTVVLTVKGGSRQIVAQDGKTSGQENTTSTVVVSKGSGVEDAVVLQQIYPQYQGALVVCPGGGDPAVRLKLVEAVAALTGLGSDKISVCRAK